MADFDRTDYWAPDSELDSDVSESDSFIIHDGSTVEIWKNDWLDIVENILPEDPYWGYALQVTRIEDHTLFVRSYNQTEDLYEEVSLSPDCVTNVFRHVVKS